jgi:hypothetical protein
MEWGENLASHRHGGMVHKRLFEGEESSPDNYILALANESSTYYSPRHRHAWDQVRFCLEGWVPLGQNLRLDAGEVAYFPEGVSYGPHEGGPDRIVLLLQFGGASGEGYLGTEQLRRGREALARQGTFEGGVFRRTSGEGKINQDAYEAIWQEVTGRPITYPKPRYKTPIVMRPDAFKWHDEAGAPGVRRKTIGRFDERGLVLEFLAIDRGSALAFQPEAARRFLFVHKGQGRADGADFRAHTAIRVEPGEAVLIASSADTELLEIRVAPVGQAPDNRA